MLGLGRIALRADDQEARRRALRALADPPEQRPADHRLVRDHEDVRLVALVLEVDDHVLDGDLARNLAHGLDNVPAHPARVLLWMGGDDDLVDPVLGERVPNRVDGIGVDHEPMGGDLRVAKDRERPVEAAARRGAASVLVHDRPVPRLADRADDGYADRRLLGVLAQRLDQALTRNRLVGDDEDVLHVSAPSLTRPTPPRPGRR